MYRLPQPLPPTDYPALLRHSTTWIPDAIGVPRSIVERASDLAGQVTYSVGRTEAIARHLLALAACQAGWVSAVARIPLFKAPGLLLADARRERFYWSLDPGLPPAFQEAAVTEITALLKRGVHVRDTAR